VSAFERIPAELRELPRWVVWRWGETDPTTGKRKKPPYCPNDLSRHASSTNPETWGTFELVASLVEAGKADGIGFYRPTSGATWTPSCRRRIATRSRFSSTRTPRSRSPGRVYTSSSRRT
jgi:hypothetical protein